MQRTIPRDTRRRRSSYLLRFERASDVLNIYMMMKASAAVLATMEGRNSAMVVATMKATKGGVNNDVNGDAVDGETTKKGRRR
ncbi:hypothetical protein RHMOL_Rhmol04G0298200 [Rhododendron molle]|uniref:Uncharacterized protein n=1 Tax=Rhododendron molle TaxID=49168 RepID=A0ACC0P7J4_RHOML|nr:hypothetical protein RHMOL_Rhmol04G0298200 [Rhododendron molle]